MATSCKNSRQIDLQGLGTGATKQEAERKAQEDLDRKLGRCPTTCTSPCVPFTVQAGAVTSERNGKFTSTIKAQCGCK